MGLESKAPRLLEGLDVGEKDLSLPTGDLDLILDRFGGV